ncbi:Arm DNA-binding domain-containing protein [Bradyrhizobium sp. Tv2a-2]|uniref:Arm DNA-binding domain-containing protein n=1 Tax=Bradyrhizobium sp. Tv2a-2 TaxID=113395 RepID=UPI00041E489A|nr:Arm DNA-binding domain-containing protein [Bradyrhizobium sp. Tv2a-2]
MPTARGLYLIVASEKSKNWSYRYWFKGKERWHGLGSFKDVSLKQARLLRDAARLQVRAGVDLVQEKRAAREQAKAAEAADTLPYPMLMRHGSWSTSQRPPAPPLQCFAF